MPDVNLRELLDICTEAAYLGGRRTLSYFNTGIDVETKSDDTPVTRADRECEQIVRGVLNKYCPSHCIVGEEHGSTAGDRDFSWYVDPIDGTKSFIHGIPLYSVLIGLEIRGRIDVGAIYLPALDELVCAATGLGCYWNGRRARVSKVDCLDQALLLNTDTNQARDRSDAYDRLEKATKIQRNAYDAYGYALVATGRAEICMDPILSDWDCGPLPVVLREAGGHFTDWKGVETIHGKEGLATNAALHEDVLKIVRSEKRKC